jgi:flagellar biosynthesis GTPase FlhF
VSKKYSINTKKPKSFKSQLKQQIENIKRAKEQEKQRKIREQVEAKREAEQQKLLLKLQAALEKQREEAQERERIAKEKHEQSMQQWREQQQWMAHSLGHHGMYVPSAYGPPILPASQHHVATAYPAMIPANYITPAKVTLQSHGDALALQGNTRSSSNQVTPDPLCFVPCKQTSPAAFSTSKSPDAHPFDPTALAEEVPLTTQTATNGHARNTLSSLGNPLSSADQTTPVPCKQTFPNTASSSRSWDVPPFDPTPLAAEVSLTTLMAENSTVEMKEKVVLKVKPNEAKASMLKETVASNVPTESELRTDTGEQILSNMPPVISEPTVASTCWDSHARASSTPLPFAGYNMHLGQPYVASMYAALPMPMPFPPYGLNPYPQTQMFAQPWVQRPPPKPIAAPPKPKPQILHRSPLDPLSPYAESHQLLREEIVIYKAPGESFGVILRFETQSTLADPDVSEGNSTDKSVRPVAKKDPSVADKATGAAEVDVVTGTDELKENSANAPGPTEGVQGGKSSVNSVTTKATTPSTQVKATSTQVSQPMVATHVTPTNVATGMSAEGNASSVAQVVPAKQRRRRRRRFFFGVLKVVQAEQQNARTKKNDPNRLLQPGDILLKLNGHDVGGLTFQQACGLFASCHTRATSSEASETHASTIRCPLVVARMKPRPKTVVHWKPTRPTNIHSSVGALAKTSQPLCIPQPKIPFVVNALTNQVISGDFSNTELLALAQGALRCACEPSRTLGYEIPLELQVECFQLVALGQREFSAIRSKREHVARSIMQSMKEAAIAHWTSLWKMEVEKMGITDDLQVPYLSDSQRRALRELPRPMKGCRCGSMNHEHVNDRRCVLYRNLRGLSANQAESDERKKESKRAKTSSLNAVETAFKDRILKLKEETQREAEEARFVNEMEEMQVALLKVAVFAPSFTAMILSAVTELSGEISDIDDVVGDTEAGTMDERCRPTVASTGSLAEGAHIDKEEDDDDDDLPLTALGKRSGPSTQEPETKRIKTQDTEKLGDEKQIVKDTLPLDLSFLAKILRHISHTWGHLYKEPSDAGYAW